MLKKGICLLLAVIMSISLIACGHKHEFDEWEESKEATCTEKGELIRRCTCGEIESKEVPAKGHSFGEWTIVKDATCTEDGKRERTCSVCGFCETEVITATSHTFEPATIFSPKYCKNCGITEGNPLGTLISLGDEVTQEEYRFELYEEVQYTNKYYDWDTTKYEASDGEVYLYLYLKYTNLGTKTVKKEDQDWITEIKLRYANKYEYDGHIILYSDGIGPLMTSSVFLVFNLPEAVKNDGEPIQASFTINGTVYSMTLREGVSGSSNE